MPNCPEMDADEAATAILGKYAKDDDLHKKIAELVLSEYNLLVQVSNYKEALESNDSCIAELTSMLESTSSALVKYGRHRAGRDGCQVDLLGDEVECVCGLDAALGGER